MKKKEVRLLFGLKNQFAVSVFQSKFGIIISNWLFQGMRYMSIYERLHRMSLEILFMILIFLLSVQILDSLIAFIVSFLIAHTIFWLFNSQFHCLLMKYIVKIQNDPKKFISYVTKINNRVNSRKCLLGAIAFGSLAINHFGDTSDIDLRLIRKKGFVNSVLAFNYCTLERARAFLNMFPLDIYVFDMIEIKRKSKPGEAAIVIFDCEGELNREYENVSINFDRFQKKFRKKFIEV